MDLQFCTATLPVQFLHRIFRSLKIVTVRIDIFHKNRSKAKIYVHASLQPASNVGMNIQLSLQKLLDNYKVLLCHVIFMYKCSSDNFFNWLNVKN